MLCQEELRQFIQDMACSNFTEETIFNSICATFGTCCQFKEPFNYEKLKNEINQAQVYSGRLERQILLIIREEVGKLPDLPEETMNTLCESMEKVSDWSDLERSITKTCYFKFLSPQHAIDLSFWSERRFLFNLLDLFFGKTRQLHLDGNVDLVTNNFDICELDSDHFLINTLTPRANATFEAFRMRTLYLMKVDRKELICKLLDKQNFPRIVESVVKDGSCFGTFYLIYNKIRTTLGNTCNLQKCCFTDSTITFENTLELNISQLGNTTGFYCKSIRINGNDMHGLLWINNEEYRHSYMMTSIKLDEDRASITNQFEVDLFGKNRMLLPPPNFVWCGQKLLVIMEDYQPTKYLAVEIDLETRNQIFIQPNLNIDHSLSYISDMVVNDGILLVCAVTKQKPLHFNRRIPLNRPDKLKAITITQLHKQTMFMDKKQRNTVMKKLPATLFF
ncbi:hypothetical protein M3Y97_01131700 [Aphelenchoides bicaudatus]|nr:hypothetical protein M3Y97_01131700 [Aphelenchoides bicaudatus]